MRKTRPTSIQDKESDSPSVELPLKRALPLPRARKRGNAHSPSQSRRKTTPANVPSTSSPTSVGREFLPPDLRADSQSTTISGAPGQSVKESQTCREEYYSQLLKCGEDVSFLFPMATDHKSSQSETTFIPIADSTLCESEEKWSTMIAEARQTEVEKHVRCVEAEHGHPRLHADTDRD